MRQFTLFVAVYMALALGGVTLVRGGTADFLLPMLMHLLTFSAIFLPPVLLVVCALVILRRVVPGSRPYLARLPVALAALGLSLLFIMTFTLVKTTLPLIVPYYADAALAAFDRALHGGTDPWILTHALAGGLPPEAVSLLYIKLWMLPAAGLPFVLMLTDPDRGRIGRYLFLYAATWVGLGNVLALAGMSVGPIYLDRLEGGARFPELLAALERAGLADGLFGEVQEFLWDSHVSGVPLLGTGISAFPSVHVGMAAVISLYLVERSPWFAPLSLGYTLAILFLSVHLGWHYAVDGYASLAVVGVLWAATRRRGGRESAPTLDVAPMKGTG